MRRDHHMRLKGELWFFQLAIPAELQQHFDGRKTIEKSLGTKDPAQARLKRDVFLVQHRADFERLRTAEGTETAEQASREHAGVMRAYEILTRKPSLATSDRSVLSSTMT